VTNGAGTLDSADVTDVTVSCSSNTFTVGGSVSGLVGSGLVLQNNAEDDLSIIADGSFTFATALDDGSDFDVSVLTQPTDPNQTCSVTNGSGTLNGASVTNIAVNCVADTFTIGGNVSGLTGTGLVLQNNNGDDLAINGNGDFTFATALDDGSNYEVSVLTQPAGPAQNCLAVNSSGTLAGDDVSNVLIDCDPATVAVSATDGMYPDKVLVSWEDTSNETHYLVYRCSEVILATCSLLANTFSDVTSYDDVSATADGTVYFYNVRACYGSVCTEHGQSDSGNRLGYPNELSATDALFEDRIRISWSDVIGESWYEVYRCTDASEGSCGSAVAAPAENTTVYEDEDASGEDTVYHYRVKSCNDNGCSGMSLADEGSLKPLEDEIFTSSFE
jgi:hypothetical protein